MILVDERTGSRELLALIRSMGCDAELTRLEAADFAFMGNGDPALCASPMIGIERKVVPDLIDSMRSRRLAGHQHVKLSRIYDECYLIVEGLWRRNRTNGYLEVCRGTEWRAIRGSVKYAEADRFLCSLEIQGGVRLWRTFDEHETAAAVADRYLWWQKPWDEHRSMQTIYAPVQQQPRRSHRPGMTRSETTLAEKVASQLPGIDSKALSVARHFGSVAAMVNATEKEWIQIDGIAKTGARNIMAAIQGERKNG